MSPARAADRQYQKAIESHFDLAHRLVRQGKVDEAEKVAKGAALLRWFAETEVRRPGQSTGEVDTHGSSGRAAA